jgi:hypothetical protein
VQTYIAKVKAD